MTFPFSNIQGDRRKKIFSNLCLFTMCLFIVHLVGQVLLQIFLKIDHTGNAFKVLPAFGLNFASTSMVSLLLSTSLDVKKINTITGIITIVLALGLALINNYMRKGKKTLLYIEFGIYMLDCLCMIPLSIIDHKLILPLNFSYIDYILCFLIHLIGVALFVFIYLFWPEEE